MPKAMRWGSKHTDKYVYNKEAREWVKVACSISSIPELRCTAPMTLPRGTKFNYNCRQ